MGARPVSTKPIKPQDLPKGLNFLPERAGGKPKGGKKGLFLPPKPFLRSNRSFKFPSEPNLCLSFSDPLNYTLTYMITRQERKGKPSAFSSNLHDYMTGEKGSSKPRTTLYFVLHTKGGRKGFLSLRNLTQVKLIPFNAQ